MSEILRAILDQNCLDSQLAFYTGQVVTVSTVTGTKTFTRREVSIPTKTDCHFLAIGGAQVAFFNGASLRGVSPKNEASTWAIRRTANQELDQNTLQIKPNLNYNLNNFVAWDEYLLFSPGEMITFVQDVQITDSTFVLTHTTLVTLQGVEYRMPPQMRIPAYA